jgi:hypothetical protein
MNIVSNYKELILIHLCTEPNIISYSSNTNAKTQEINQAVAINKQTMASHPHAGETNQALVINKSSLGSN